MSVSLTVSGLRVRRGDRQLTCPDTSLTAGDRVALCGPSGVGKTSLLLAMAGLLRPDAGDISVNGQIMWNQGDEGRARLRGRSIGYVFAAFHLVDALTVMDNLLLARACAGLTADRGRAVDVLDRLGLADLASRRADRLSQGQMQRVALARALMNAPSVLLCDEPTAALDDDNAQSLIGLLLDLARTDSLCLLVATHDARLMTAMDHVVRLGA